MCCECKQKNKNKNNIFHQITGEWFFTTSSPVSSPTSLSSSPTSFSSSPPPSLPSASPFKTKVFDQVGVCVILPSQHVVGFLVPFLGGSALCGVVAPLLFKIIVCYFKTSPKVDATQVKDIRRLKIRVEDNRRQIPTEIKETWGVLEGSFRVRKPCQPLFYVEYDGQHVIGWYRGEWGLEGLLINFMESF